MIDTKVVFTYLGNILKGTVIGLHGEDMVLIKSTRGKNYLVENKQIVRRIF
jgi:hypothetical protein